ncbi:fimbria/pilus outer membrane usher protein [Dyella sp. ASV21]|uniref:fimbria/pilus outer membrane usher protein n=1 Tax=Dyella sp. ASV21 TaxID=2795114 RepID=UPI0018EAA23F|nr:fimbria/pilus outer membrane usher protein [Dyella sp. ASV21]
MARRPGKFPRRHVVILMLALCVTRAHADDPLDTLVPYGSTAERDVHLETSVNGSEERQLLHFKDQQGKLATTGEELEHLGFDIARMQLSREDYVRLDDIDGLDYTYTQAELKLDLRAADQLLKPLQLRSRATRGEPASAVTPGFLANYDVYFQSQGSQRLSLLSEVRYFDTHGVLIHSGVASEGASSRRYVRYDTYWTRSDQARMRTLRVGDTVSSALDWTRPLRIAGVQWGRNFELRPDLVTFPVDTFTGTAMVPSWLTLYVNGVQQYSTGVPQGPFTIDHVPGITGAGDIAIVTRDALGRTITKQTHIYVDPRMLSQGMSDYSVEAGLVRERYGQSSLSYGHVPVASASGRYGYSSRLTMEGHVEVTDGLLNMGVGSLVKLDQAGVLQSALSLSHDAGLGGQFSVGYQYSHPWLSLSAQASRTFRAYADLAAKEQAAVPTATHVVSLAVPLGRSRSAAFSYAGYRYPQANPVRFASFGFTSSPTRNVSLSLSIYRNLVQTKGYEGYLGVSVSLGGSVQMGASANVQRQAQAVGAYAQKSADYAGGWGWMVQGGAQQDSRYAQGNLERLTRYGDWNASFQRYGEVTNVTLEGSGSVVFMSDVWVWSRRIQDGFALVSTGAPEVEVLSENRSLGRTGASGYLLVPDLAAYRPSRLSINPDALPSTLRVEKDHAVVVPSSGSGSLVSLDLKRVKGATLVLTTADGAFVPVGSVATHQNNGEMAVVGYDGMLYVDELFESNHLRVQGEAIDCDVRFAFAQDEAAALPTLGPLVCTALEATDRAL